MPELTEEEMMAEEPVGCRSCGRPILWRTNSRSGARLCINATPDAANGTIRINGDITATVLKEDELSDALSAGVQLFTSHFSTCPDADEWRQKAKERG